MNYGLTDTGEFYVDYTSCRYTPGNMRVETDRRAAELGKKYSNIWVSNSGGVDSQAMIISLKNMSVPFESAFMWHPGYNDDELEQIKAVDKKNNISTHIIEVDANEYKEEILEKSNLLDTHPNSVLQTIFTSKLPDDANLVAMTHDPFILMAMPDSGGPPVWPALWMQGWYSPELMRHRADVSMSRSGETIYYGDTPEMIYSILTDDVFQACHNAWQYFRDNKLTKNDVSLNTVDRWDYYIKPIIYGKYWTRDEMIFYTKNQGFKKYDWINKLWKGGMGEKAVVVKLEKYIELLKMSPGTTKRFYQNVTNDVITRDKSLVRPSEFI